MDEATKNMLKQAIGITDEDLNKLSPRISNLLANMPNFMGHRLVAEVTESKYCFHGLKKGDKIIIEGGKINPQASTASLCLGAIAPLDDVSALLMDRIAMGWKPDGSIITHTRCHDMGVDHGGLGLVYFKVYTEPIQ
jgi:uncharacterized repeat protein (TIGR04076 family)